ncbi:MAG: tRNA (N6-isopentenyl adenosine(37)-C2)-methylthiotransferase MiaB [Kiritimatiellia bacterium]
MKFFIKTYGCQMNERDSEAMAELLRRSGHEAVQRESDARAVIVNTCSVREKAEQKALGKLGLLAASRAQMPGRIVGAAGCMVQRLKGGIFGKVDGLDFAVGTYGLHLIPDVLEKAAAGRRVLELGREKSERAPFAEVHYGARVTAFVNVLFGCNRRCTYCVVPDVRGPERSRPITEIAAEVRGLVSGGTKEAVLLGQSVMSYGRDGRSVSAHGGTLRPYSEPLPALLEAVARESGVKRIRFTSGHPDGCTAELARAIREVPAVCEHLHMPLQSGSDRVLKMMRRGYTTGDYMKAVSILREAVPEIAITTDIIVGFPSESAEDFERTRRLMEEIGFDNAFIFKYSSRPGTRAAEFEDDLPLEEKKRRNQTLLRDQQERGERINRRFIGRNVEVLAEGPSPRNAARWFGRTRDNRIVLFDPAKDVRTGDLVMIEVNKAMPQTLHGRVVKGEAGVE